MANLNESVKDETELVKNHCVELFSSMFLIRIWGFNIPEFILVRDYVMEPGVVSTLLAYFTAGGEAEKVVELLTKNYDGLAQYANLFGCWLSDLQREDSTEISTISTNDLLAEAQQRIEFVF